jgi:hypothetical protein
MEPREESKLRDMLGPWIYISREPLFKPNFRSIDVLVFASSGLSCGLAISNMLHVIFKDRRGSIASTSLIVIIALCQAAYLAREQRRMKAMYEEIKTSSKRVEEMMQDAPPEAANGPRRVQ